MGSKWDIDKFTDSNDFVLWKVKMRTILIQQMCVEALNGEAQMSVHMTPTEMTKMNDKTVSVIILCLRDKVLREVTRETIVVSM
ncbi:ubiquitin-protein ligase [Trifolium pratense]|uniref:Ubiquitin-protein ligase n=1 Tax=Trifolium pratense TaxID=57577 RepID=A0A2K3LE17_TRIPR|nr:ubiquitin-protein ligase [Trifolium pratense]